jgi:hypothetical protein
MAEILLAQDLWQDAAFVVEQIGARSPDDPRLDLLRRRIEERAALGEIDETPLPATGEDRMSLATDGRGLVLSWELTRNGIEIARRAARFSGRRIVRLFTAAVGPRGVRTGTRDIEVSLDAGQLVLKGVVDRAVHVAAAGFLARSGVFVPLARSLPVGGAA